MRQVIFCLLVGLFCWVACAEEYKVNVAEDYAFQVGQQKTTRLIQAIYAPLNISPKVYFLPSERGLSLVNSGDFDAEGGRISAIGSRYENLLPVPEPLYTTEFAYFCLQKERCYKQENAIHVMPKGDLITERFCQQNQLNCFFVNNDISAFKALETENADLLISTMNIASGVVCNSNVRQAFYLPEPNIDGALYHHVNIKHKDKIPALAAAIKALKSKGVFSQFSKELKAQLAECDAKFQALPLTAPEQSK